MNVHYVDDDDADLAIMLATAKKLPEVSLTTSRTLETLFDRIKASRVDCILLDINRPDTTSLEDDMDAIRQITYVPVILMTGGFANDYRIRATLAGADGVIEKSALSRELLDQVLKNARARVLAHSVHGSGGQPDEIPYDVALPLPQWLDQLHKALDKVEASLDPSVADNGLSLVQEVREAVSTSRQELAKNPSVTACVPMRWALNAAIEDVAPRAIASGVELVLAETGGTFFPKGPRELGYMGFRFLLDGMVRTLEPGGRIQVSSQRADESGCTIDLHLNRHGLSSKEAFFQTHPGQDSCCPRTGLRLRLAALLLGMSRKKISVEASVEAQSLRVAL